MTESGLRFKALATVAVTVTVLSGAVDLRAQSAAQELLAAAKTLKCDFPIVSTGTWKKDGTPTMEQKPADLMIEFDEIDIAEGSAHVVGLTGAPNLIARLALGSLHLLAMDNNGPLHVTTVFAKQSHPGTLRAVHTRHEFTDTEVPGFTSRPELYYGECEVGK